MFTFCTQPFYFYTKLTVKHFQPRNNNRVNTVEVDNWDHHLVKITRGQPQNDFKNTEFRLYGTSVVNKYRRAQIETMRGVARERAHIFLYSLTFSCVFNNDFLTSSEHKNRQKVVLDLVTWQTDVLHTHVEQDNPDWLVGVMRAAWTLQGLFDSAVNAALRSNN